MLNPIALLLGKDAIGLYSRLIISFVCLWVLIAPLPASLARKRRELVGLSLGIVLVYLNAVPYYRVVWDNTAFLGAAISAVAVSSYKVAVFYVWHTTWALSILGHIVMLVCFMSDRALSLSIVSSV